MYCLFSASNFSLNRWLLRSEGFFCTRKKTKADVAWVFGFIISQCMSCSQESVDHEQLHLGELGLGLPGWRERLSARNESGRFGH
jgi:hypothetical protein